MALFTGTYVYSENPAASQIVRADKSVGGSIYGKGAPALMAAENEEERKLLPPWSIFGLQMLPDASLNFFASCGKGAKLINNRTASPIPPDTWVHVAVVQDGLKSLIYVNGEVAAEATMSATMLSPGKAAAGTIIEVQWSRVASFLPLLALISLYQCCLIHICYLLLQSTHPYADNMDNYETVSIPGALSLTVSFDPLSSTELNCDYIRFYKDSSHSEFWGESSYWGGRNGSQKNFPGVDGQAPLVIPADNFVMYFHSDGSNNDVSPSQYSIPVAVAVDPVL